MKKICVITDNEYLYGELKRIIDNPIYADYHFDFYYSEKNKRFYEKYKERKEFRPIDLKKADRKVFSQYILFFSLHCKQMFPEELVSHYRCINIHPGYNPYNRGWFPQVFSIINKKPVGVTIHEMDHELDHGPILFQEFVKIKLYDTSWDVYRRIQEKETEMLEKYLMDIIEENYNKISMLQEGNVNYKSDFNKLCYIDLNKKATYGEVIDLLRAMTFEKYDNAYFIDEDGNKIYVSINMKKENNGVTENSREGGGYFKYKILCSKRKNQAIQNKRIGKNYKFIKV